jgi:hypothetical protein
MNTAIPPIRISFAEYLQTTGVTLSTDLMGIQNPMEVDLISTLWTTNVIAIRPCSKMNNSMKKIFGIVSVLVVTNVYCYSQYESVDIKEYESFLKKYGEIGTEKSEVKARMIKSGANLSEGLNKDGFTFLMDEDSNNDIAAHFFNDDLKCVSSFYSYSGDSKRFIIRSKEILGKQGTKIENNIYSVGELLVQFGIGSEGKLTMKITNRDIK